MTRFFVAPLLLLAGCPYVAAPEACADLPAPPPVGACFGQAGLDHPGLRPVELAVTGTVTSVTTGPFPEECDIRFGLWRADDDADDDALLLVISDPEGVLTTVGIVMPDLEAPMAVGDTVSLDLGHTEGGFGPDVGWAALTDEMGVEQVVVGLAGTEAGVRTPADLRIGGGHVRCTQADPCGIWSAYDLDVEADGVVASLPYGETGRVGGWTVTHAGFERQLEGADVSCPDWFVARVSVGFVRE